MVPIRDDVIGYYMKSPATNNCIVFWLKNSGYHCHWDFNGDLEKPTFSPSMLLYEGPGVVREHFFVRNGKIQYLNDCGHELRNQVVDMIDLEGELE